MPTATLTRCREGAHMFNASPLCLCGRAYLTLQANVLTVEVLD